jgi:predicted TIM-barrel fold metal-dependent hydrolase
VKGKIAIEEHFAIAETVGDSRRMSGEYWRALDARLLDFECERLDEMDNHGIGFAILSLNSPAVQSISQVELAIDTARRANACLAEQIHRHPRRFGGFAALPMQNPHAAARELHRCMHDLKFRGALVNSFSQRAGLDGAIYYDASEYLPFWQEMEALHAPFYMHPRNPLPDRRYDGHPWLIGSTWSFGEETALHALRLMASGLFDTCPDLQIILGHLGERIPYDISRLDRRLKQRPDCPAQRPLGEYFNRNFHITTSGHFRTQTLVAAMSEVGADRILFAVDYPFERHAEACTWFDNASIAETDREKIGCSNARALFMIDN